MHTVVVTIKAIEGKCPQEFKAGDSWTINDGKTPSSFCASAFHTIYPTLIMMQTGGSLPWAEDKDLSVIACPDAANRAVYELKRIKD